MTLILHITPRKQWQDALESGMYVTRSLATEGFIHCSLPRQVVFVANSRFQGETSLVLLCIDSGRVASDIRYEGEIDEFPHLYGPLNIDAVTAVLDFPPGPDGRFSLPQTFLDLPAM